jgi:hypothetical protein
MYSDTYEIASVTSFLRNDIVTQSRRPLSRRRPNESREPDIITLLDSPVSSTEQAPRHTSIVRKDGTRSCQTSKITLAFQPILFFVTLRPE